ncbi:hypothetical protein SAZ11_15450 [Streptomyces sp. FXJ1.4098]|nr:hypothetical protein [Streptomyces sp. FXJ1.4098]
MSGPGAGRQRAVSQAYSNRTGRVGYSYTAPHEVAGTDDPSAPLRIVTHRSDNAGKRGRWDRTEWEAPSDSAGQPDAPATGQASSARSGPPTVEEPAAAPLLSPRIRHASGVGTFHFAPGTPLTVGQDGAGSGERDERSGIAYPAPVQINVTPVSAADPENTPEAGTENASEGGPGWSVSSWRPVGSPGMVRFASLYRDREWRRRSVALEFALAGVVSGVGAITESARDATFRMYERLAARHGEAAAARAFFPHDAVPADPAAALERLRTLPPGPLTLDELMTALTHAAYAGPGLPSELAEVLSRPVGRRARYAPGSAYRAVHDSRGFRRVGGERGPALRLLGAYAALGASRAELLAFRSVLMAWMIPADLQSLHEIFRASHLIGMGDAEERSVTMRDAAGLHNWAAEAAKGAGFRRLGPDDALFDQLTPPHRALYDERMRYDRRSTPSALDVPDDLESMVDSALAGLLPSVTRRSAVLQRWLRHYGPRGRQALDRLAPAHMTALHLYSGPDYRLMKAFLNGERLGSGMGRRMVRLSVWSVTRRAAAVDEADFLPMMLRKQPNLEDLFDEMRAVPDLGASSPQVSRLRTRLNAMADRLYAEMPLHIDMAIEALEILPPVNGDVWWGDRGVPGSLDEPPVDGPVYGRDTITMPFFRSTSLLHGQAHGFMTRSKRAPEGSHPGLVHVPGSTAREISPFVVFLSETEAVYPPGATFDITRRSVIGAPADRQRYEAMVAEEVTAPMGDASDRSIPSVRELGALMDLFHIGRAADTAEEAERPAPVLREIRAEDGRVIGVASFDDADWAVRRNRYARLDRATDYVSWERDAEGRPVATHRALPGGGAAGGTFFFASHGGAEGLALAEEGGGVRRDDGAYTGRLLKWVRGRGFRSVTVVACGPGDVPGSVEEARARAQRFADAAGLPVHLEVGRSAVSGGGQVHLLEDAEKRATGWVTAYPAGWPVPAAASAPAPDTGTPGTTATYPAPAQVNATPVSAADPQSAASDDGPGWSVSSWRPAGSPGRVRFARLYRDREWRRRSVAMEFVFAGYMGQIGAFTEIARDAVFRMYQELAARHGEAAAQRAFFPSAAVPANPAAALERLRTLPPGPLALDELMAALTHASYAGPGLPRELAEALSRPVGRRARYARAVRTVRCTTAVVCAGWAVRVVPRCGCCRPLPRSVRPLPSCSRSAARSSAG